MVDATLVIDSCVFKATSHGRIRLIGYIGVNNLLIGALVVILLLATVLISPPSTAGAAPRPDVDEADNRVRAEFERVNACLADRRWDEAVEMLRGLMENAGEKLWPVNERRYITVREYCQLRLVALPPEALAIYRGRVDPLAKTWYEDGFAERDRAKLMLVARRAFASIYGDDSLLALGEMALARADYAAARGYWEKILAVDTDAAHAGAPDASGLSTWLAYPDSDIDPAAVRARLVLASILEGSSRRARRELDQFTKLHADAVGRFGGSETNYAKALARLLNESRKWPPLAESPDWYTFAGTQRREKIVAGAIDVAGPAWRIRLREQQPDSSGAAALCFHPVVVGSNVFVAKGHEILGLDLRTDQPAWGQSGAAIFRDELGGEIDRVTDRIASGSTGREPRAAAAAAQHTLTAEAGLLLCRMNSPAAVREGRIDRSSRSGSGYLIGLELQSEGRLLWRIDAENADWVFEGAPVSDGKNIYASMRIRGPRPQAYVACFDAQTGRRRWRRFICGGEAMPRSAESRQLLTLAGERIYYNTNLGVVAGLSTVDGEIQWLSLYPRIARSQTAAPQPASTDKLAVRDLNPALFHQGVLYVAPSDSRRIYAIDAVTGQILWRSGTQVEDVEYLLGVAGDRLIASGERLYWIATGPQAGGKLKHVWPLSNRGPGFGRGLLAGGYVYWPTHEKIFVFEQESARLVDSIDLAAKRASGGNLVAACNHLLIATPTELIVFDCGNQTSSRRTSPKTD